MLVCFAEAGSDSMMSSTNFGKEHSSTPATTATPKRAKSVFRAADETSKLRNMSLPQCWTDELYVKFREEYAWLFFNNGKLGCKVCKQINKIGQTSRQVWVLRCRICGWPAKLDHTKIQKLNDRHHFGKKIHIHRKSKGHVAAVNALRDRHDEMLPSNIAAQNSNQFSQTCAVFRTAYYIAKSDRPYYDYPDLIDLQELNSIDLGRVLHSNVLQLKWKEKL